MSLTPSSAITRLAYSLDSSGLWVPQTPSTGAVDLIPPPYLGVPSASFVYGEHWVPYPQLRTTANDGDRPMVDPEAFGLGMPGEQARVIVRRIGGDFTLTSYGNGELLGTRGDTLVMLLPDPVGSNRIVFIDY